MDNVINVSIAPHIKSKNSTEKIMWAIVLALIPSGAAGVFIFGVKALLIIIVSILSALAAEWIIVSARKQQISIFDGSAFLTGLLLAYNLPPQVPLWLPAVGAFFAVIIGKQVFGGLGHNIFNPALAGRAFLMVSWPVYMTTWQNPRWWHVDTITSATVDAVTTATPLALFKHKNFDMLNKFSYWDLFIGNRGGCIGEVCVAMLVIGAAYLLWKKYISWHIPFTYIGTVATASWIFNGREKFFTGDILFFILSGGLILGAFFMATDYVTSPLSSKGKIIFGVGCGILTFIIRKFSGYPEGVSYSILIMNATVPLIDKYTFPKWFGYKKQDNT